MSEQLRGPGQRLVRHHEQLPQPEDLQRPGGVLHPRQKTAHPDLQVSQEASAQVDDNTLSGYDNTTSA